MILSITGPSGVGKTTLMSSLLHALADAAPLTSVTTRAPRPTDGKREYEYVSQTDFTARSEREEFLWEVHPHGKSYATAKKTVDAALASECFFIAPLVISAVERLRVYVKTQGKSDAVRAIYIWIENPEELRARFTNRGDMTPEEIESRLEECRSWNAEAKASGLPFIFLQATNTPEEILRDALKAIASRP
jgi:guanylate kinase